jgi:uncharacterized damage-inducible protein DinB
MDKKSFIRYWQNVRKLTIRLLDEFPADSFDYRPAPEIMTVAQLYKHILMVETYIREGFLTARWEIPEETGASIFEKETIRDRLTIENQKTARLLAEVPEGKFMKIMPTPFGDLSGELVLMVAVDEEIHHRGNLYVYLRCLGKTPPQMIQDYGEILRENDDVSENQPTD